MDKIFKELLESAEGLTEEFKAEAPKIFEQAVNSAVESQVAEKMAQADIDYAKRLSESVSAKALEIKESYMAELQNMAEKIALLESEIDKEKEKAKVAFEMVANQFSEMVESETERKVSDLANQINDYANYVVKEFVEQHKPEIVAEQTVAMAKEFMGSFKSLLETHNIADVDQSKGLEKKVSELVSENNSVYESLSNAIKENDSLKKELDSIKRAELVKGLSESLTDTDKERFGSIVESLGFMPFEQFESKVTDLAKSFEKADFKPAEPQKTVVSESVVVEKAEPTTKVVAESVDPMVELVYKSLLRQE